MKLWLDVLNGFPSIVIGIFVFELIVAAAFPVLGIGHHQSAWAGGFALSIIMVPLVARTTMEVLALVPNHLREASYALGVSKWRTVVSVVVPSALGGIVTGTTLAVARAAGETAPLLFTCSIFGQVVSTNPSLPVASIPVIIFEYSEAPDKNLNAQAWAAAFVLIVFVLVTTLISRMTPRSLPAQARAGAVGASVCGSPPRHLPSHPFARLGWRLGQAGYGSSQYPRTRRNVHEEDEGAGPSRRGCGRTAGR